MSRPASEYTQAIRNLLDETGGKITHAEARPRLKKLGFEIATEPAAKSDAFVSFEQYAVDLDDEASVAKAAKACKFDAATLRHVIREAKQRAAFKSERNNFDVTKYNWSKNKDSARPSPSRKPVSSKNTKAKTAAVTSRKAGTLPKPKHRRGGRVAAVAASATPGADAVLDLVTKHGGVSAVQTRIAELRAEADRLAEAVEAVLALEKRLKEAA